MRILITGVAGHIGVNTAIEASARGHEVIGMDNFVRALTEENIATLQLHGVKIIRGDIRNPEDFDKLPTGIEGIVHLAGQCGIPWSLSLPQYDFEVNVVGTINVLEYARRHGKIPVAFASTNKVYTDMLNDVPLKELETRYEYDLPENMSFHGVTASGIKEHFPLDAMSKFARSPYGTSKVSADLYCQEYWHAFGVPTIINRMSCIYGYYQKGVEDQGWIDWFLRTIAFGNGKIRIFGSGKQVRDMLFGSDVARLYIDELENAASVAGQVFNVGGGSKNTWSLLEAVKHIEELTGRTATLEFVDWRHADQRVVYMDISKVKEKLGWEPRISPQVGVEMMYEKYQLENLI